MVKALNSNKSIFLENWTLQKNNNDKTQMSRKVKVGGKTYQMTVEYRSSLFSDSQNPLTNLQHIKELVETSEKELKKFILAHHPKVDTTVKLEADLIESNATIIKYNRVSPQENNTTSLQDLKKTSRKLYSITDKLVHTLADGYDKMRLSSGPTKVLESNSSKKLGENHAQKALDLIESLKKVGQTGVVSFKGQSFKIPVEDKYGRRKWEIEIDGEKYEVNEYKENSYNGPTTEDFIKRQELICNASKQYIESKKILNKDAVLKAIDYLEQGIVRDLNQESFQVDWKTIQAGKEDITKDYEKSNQLATKRIAQFARDVQEVIDQSLGKNSFSIKDLDLSEKEYVLNRGRPTIINTFTYKGSKILHMHVPESKEYLSKNTSVGLNTIPSTIRNRLGLANYISTYGGFINPEGQVKITYQGMRHSSYPPIAIESAPIRQAIASENVKQGLKDVAYKILATNPRDTSRRDPLVIPLRSMLLFTPIIGDFLRNRSKLIAGEWTGQGEVLQFEESLLALKMFHGRTFPINLGEDVVWVKPDISLMNLGANTAAAGKGLFGALPQAPLEEAVNSRGFVEFIDEVEAVLQDAALSDPLRKAVNELCQLEKGNLNYGPARDSINKLHKSKDSALRKMYAKLEKLNNKNYLSGNKSLELKIEMLKHQIEKQEKTFYSAYSKLLKVMRSTYLKKRDKNETLVASIENLFAEEINKSKTFEEKEALTLLLKISLNLYSAKKIFYLKKSRSLENVMDFQSIYIQTHSTLNNFIEFFCKSGEDRTGRIDDKVLEREIFYQTYMRLPVKDQDLALDHEGLVGIVHQFSASQNTTEQNSNARGEMVSSEINPEFTAKLDKLQASLAKRVIKQAGKLKPSEEALTAMTKFRVIPIAIE